MIVPVTGGTQVISREGTEVGSPSQGFPKWKSIGILDWDLANFGATLTGRYISKLKEVGRQRDELDVLHRPAAALDAAGLGSSSFGFALGVNNLFNVKAPGCITCDLNNFDPTDVRRSGPLFLRPGRAFEDVRRSLKSLGSTGRAVGFVPAALFCCTNAA